MYTSVVNLFVDYLDENVCCQKELLYLFNIEKKNKQMSLTLINGRLTIWFLYIAGFCHACDDYSLFHIYLNFGKKSKKHKKPSTYQWSVISHV